MSKKVRETKEYHFWFNETEQLFHYSEKKDEQFYGSEYIGIYTIDEFKPIKLLFDRKKRDKKICDVIEIISYLKKNGKFTKEKHKRRSILSAQECEVFYAIECGCCKTIIRINENDEAIYCPVCEIKLHIKNNKKEAL